MHEGIDVANHEGTPVRAPWRGRVVRVRRSRGSGLHVVVASGLLRVTMTHLSTAEVSEGDDLSKGDLVGLMGHTGRVTGDHLHLQIKRDGKNINPRFSLASCEMRR